MRYTRYEPEQDISLRFTMLYNTSTEEGKQAFPDWANDNLINVEMPEFGSGINNINNRSNGQNIITNINLKRQA
ncbi:MAG: hypothetical protein JW894_04375 [Bacteroidales bacterium]|nr:hypothetical protein [Bacteroidales bacterium]